MTSVTVYTDGSSRGNPGPGGYGALIEFVDSMGQLHVKELSQGYEKTTNNRMELMAAIAALEALNRPCEVSLWSDSQYLINAFNQHWIDSWKKKKGMKNKTQYKVAEVDYRYFKGANYYNERRGDDIIHVGVLIYLGSKKNNIFSSDTSTHTFPDIRFFPNDATILESWTPVLDELAEYLKDNDRKGVLLSGYADNQGTEAYISGISRQRAMEVKKALLLRGIDATRIEIIAKGDADPIGDNSTHEGRAMNNRVNIKIQ